MEKKASNQPWEEEKQEREMALSCLYSLQGQITLLPLPFARMPPESFFLACKSPNLACKFLNLASKFLNLASK